MLAENSKSVYNRGNMLMREQEVELVGYLRPERSLKRMAYLATKRAFDILVATVALVPCLPVFAVVALAIKIDSRGGVFFTQSRIGQNGKEFKIYKFRTMVPNADEVLEEILAGDSEFAREYRKNKKMRYDPRVTRVGKFLRRTSIDELPQLLNVLLGDMSVIGNRPYMPREKKEMGEYFDEIVKTKPGMTGYWQVSGRNDISFEHRLELEAYYSRHHNLRMDLEILLATPGAVIFGRGAK